MRLFVALEIPSAVRENLANLLQSLRAVSPQTKWVRPENLHVTLKFIGEAPQATLAGICGALAEVRSEQPVTLEFRRLGSFPNDKHPRAFLARCPLDCCSQNCLVPRTYANPAAATSAQPT